MHIRLWMLLSIITGIFSATCIAQSFEYLEAVEGCNATFSWTYSGSVTSIDWYKGIYGDTDAVRVMLYDGVSFRVSPDFITKITYIDPNEVSDTVGMILLSANTDDSSIYSVQITPTPVSGAPVNTNFTTTTASQYVTYKKTVKVAVNGATSIEHGGGSDHILSATGPGPLSIVVSVPATYGSTTTTCIHLHYSDSTETSCDPADCVATSCPFTVNPTVDKDSIVISIQPDILQCAELFNFTVPVDDDTTTTIATLSDPPDSTVTEPDNLPTSNSPATPTDEQITSDHATDDPGIGTTDDDNDKSDSVLELWHKVLIGLGCALVLIIIIVVIVCCVRRKDNKFSNSMSSAGSADGERTNGYHNRNAANQTVIQSQKESPIRSVKHGTQSGNGSQGGPGLGYSPVAHGYGGGSYHHPGHLDQPGHPGPGVLVAQGAHVSVNVGARPVVADMKNPSKSIVSGYNGAYTNPVYDYRSEPQTDY